MIGPGISLFCAHLPIHGRSLCSGPTIDIGCGPGRFVAALHHKGITALGVDISLIAVNMTISKGAPAHHGDVFDAIPLAGQWDHVLLADGNIGIGGNPQRLLERVVELLAPGGTVIAELDPRSSGITTTMARWETASAVGRWFPWANVGIDAVKTLAHVAGLSVDAIHQFADRHIAVWRDARPKPHPHI